MPDVLYPRYVPVQDHRGYRYVLDVENGLAVCCGSPDFINPTSAELAADVANRINDGRRDPSVYEWYPMSVDVRVEPARQIGSTWINAARLAVSPSPAVPVASPAPCYAEAAH